MAGPKQELTPQMTEYNGVLLKLESAHKKLERMPNVASVSVLLYSTEGGLVGFKENMMGGSDEERNAGREQAVQDFAKKHPEYKVLWELAYSARTGSTQDIIKIERRDETKGLAEAPIVPKKK